MDNELQLAILGVAGTLFGTILGWALNNLSQKGKLKIHVNDRKLDFFIEDKFGGWIDTDNPNEAKHYKYDILLDIYNSSRDVKIMRNIRIVYFCGRKRLFEDTPKDGGNKGYSSPLLYYEEATVMNIPPKSVVSINFNNGFNNSQEEWKSLFKANKIVLEYTNENNHKKCVTILKK